LLKRAGYSWKFIKHDGTECTAAFYYGGQPMLDEAGKRTTVTWTYDDAKKALLTGTVGESKAPSMYDKYGADMLYNRMIVRFQRRFAPEVTAGMVVYTPDELEEIENRDLDSEIERKNAPGVAEVKAAEAVATRKIAELKAEAGAAQAELTEAVPEPPIVPARPADAPRPTMPEVRGQRPLTMPKRGE
jgi:hypothetical protein